MNYSKLIILFQELWFFRGIVHLLHGGLHEQELGIAAARKAHGVEVPHELLAEKPHIGGGIIVPRRGKHSAGSARLIAYGDGLPRIEDVIASLGGQEGDKQLDGVASSVELSGSSQSFFRVYSLVL